MSRPPKTYRQSISRRTEREKKREQRDQEKELDSLRRQVARLEKRLRQRYTEQPEPRSAEDKITQAPPKKVGPVCRTCMSSSIKTLTTPVGVIYQCDDCGGRGKL